MRRPKYIPIVLFLSFVFSATQGQESMVFPNFRLGWTPSAVFNEHQGIQVSLDKKLSQKVNFSLESAYIFNSFGNGQGFRIRPGIETFVARSSWVSVVSGIHYNFRYTLDYANIFRRSTNAEFNFIDYNRRTLRTLGGINLENKLMFKITERWYLDIGGGLGLGTSRRVGDPQVFFRNGALFETVWIRRQPEVIFYTHLNLSYAISL